jgi:hypothetical protein
MNTFTKWFLLNAVMFTAIFFAEQRGLISTMIEGDLSHISVLIMSLYAFMSAFVGRLCYLSDKISKDNTDKRAKEKNYLAKRSDVGWFAAEHFFSLGLLGTIIGLY